MARLTTGRLNGDLWLGLGLVAALAALALIRIAFGGWGPLAPDDARYLYVGLSILDGQGPVNPSGTIFLLRSPVYGLSLAVGSSLVGGDPLVGARIVAVALTVLGLLGALRLGWLLAGPGGAVGSAIILIATPLLWRLIPSLRIDLPQTAIIVAVLLAVWRPSLSRWAVGGVLLGLAVLIKETALPVLLMPVALVGFVPLPRVARLAAVFVGAAVVTAAWWWVVVWLVTGQVFPLNALSIIEARDVDAPLRVDRSTVPLLVAIVAGWGLVAWQARHAPGARLLLVAAACLAPAALYAASLGLNARNFAGLAVLSAVAVGAGGAWLVAGLREQRGAGSAALARPARIVATFALAGVAVVALAAPVIGQRDVGRTPPDHLADDLAGWLAVNAPEGGRIVSAFREREEMALRQFGRAEVAILPLERVDPAAPPDSYLWMGLRDRQLYGYGRAAWLTTLVDPPADVLMLVGAHPFTPFDLTAEPSTAARLGLTLAATLEADGDRAEIHRVDLAMALAGTPDVPIHLSAAAASAWLDLGGGDAAIGRLLAAGPVVTGDDNALRTLLDRLGSRACAAPAPAAAIQLGPAGSCPS